MHPQYTTITLRIPTTPQAFLIRALAHGIVQSNTRLRETTQYFTMQYGIIMDCNTSLLIPTVLSLGILRRDWSRQPNAFLLRPIPMRLKQ